MSTPNSETKEIVFLLSGLHFGGTERAMLNLMGGFAERGANVELLLIEGSGAFRQKVPVGVQVTDFGKHRTLMALPLLIDYLRNHSPLVLVAAKTHINVAALVSKLLSQVCTRFVVCERSYYQFLNGQRSLTDALVIQLARFLYRRADAITAVSEDVAVHTSKITGVPREGIRVLPNPVVTPDLRLKARGAVEHPWLSEEIPVLVSAGRLVREKGYDVLLHAMRQVCDCRTVRLMVLGDGPDRELLVGLARSLGIGGLVEFLGYVENPLPFMREAEVYVLSSRHEGFPNVLVEALYCGTPVVATRCSSVVTEIVATNRCGTLVDVEDCDSLAAGIKRVLVKRNVKDLAQECRGIAERFSLERAVSEYGRVFEKCQEGLSLS